MHEHDAWFGEFFADKPQRLAEDLLGTEVVGKNLQYFNKPAAGGQPTPPHQDGFYFKLNPPHALTMWMALEDVDEENGCVHYVKGSHLKGMREHGRTGTLGFSQGMTDFGRQEDLAAEEAVPAAPGDLLAHHALTIHRARREFIGDAQPEGVGVYLLLDRSPGRPRGRGALQEGTGEAAAREDLRVV